MDMDALPFVYREEIAQLEHRILYYETMRGCPFDCQYCLSSVEKGVRFRSLDQVFPELQFFLDHKVRQVKFVDRTFNCNKAYASAIWRYLMEHDNQVSNFHFEIAADLLDDEQIELLSHARKGLFQLEIGVQSTNPDTLSAIHRKSDFQKLSRIVRRLPGPWKHPSAPGSDRRAPLLKITAGSDNPSTTCTPWRPISCSWAF